MWGLGYGVQGMGFRVSRLGGVVALVPVAVLKRVYRLWLCALSFLGQSLT